MGVNGQHIVFYKHWLSGGKFIWSAYPRKTTGYTYSNTKDWLMVAEQMMRGDRSNVMWRVNDEQARRMVWC